MRGVDVNKKGQQMTLGTIIAIVLGLVVLVFLISDLLKVGEIYGIILLI